MKNASTSHYDTIVIGSGAGGLTAAVALSRANQKVLVLEQHYVPGGWCHSFQIQGQKFSPGVHYIGGLSKGEQLRETYEGLGLAKELTFFKMVHKGFEHCLIGDERFDYASNFDSFENDLIERFPEERRGISKYLKILRKAEKQIINLSRAEKGYQKILLLFQSGTLFRHGWKTVDKVISRCIKDQDLKAILSVQCGDIGLTPKKANFAYFSAVMGHYASGGYFPMGGGAAIVKSMTNELKRNKGEVRCQSRVEEILIKDNRAIGVRLTSGEEIMANTIVSNADPHITFKKLIDEKLFSKKLKKKLENITYSPSSLMLFVTIDMDVKKHGIDSGNYWISKSNDMENSMEFNSIEEIVGGEKFDAVFLGCSTLKDPSSFNGRYYNFELVTFVDSSFFVDFKTDSEEYLSYKEKISQKLLNNLDELIPGAKQHVVQMELGTPKTNKFFINATHGNVYGIAKTLAQLGPGAFNTRSEFAGLYLCGSSTLSHGVAGATNSGLVVASQILKTSVKSLLTNPDGDELDILDAEDSSTWPTKIKNKIQIRASRFKGKILRIQNVKKMGA